MARLVLLHHDKRAGEMLRLMAADHEVSEGKDLKAAMQQILQVRPDAVVVAQDSQQDLAGRILKWMRQSALKIPVVAILPRNGIIHKPVLLKLGAAAFLDEPADRGRLNAAIVSALERARKAAAGPPPICEEELGSNLSVLEHTLNRQMKCFAGKNKVFIQSTLLGTTTSRPRICLKCSLREDYGLPPEMYYEGIRDVCCTDPSRCDAARQYGATRETA
jgi:DNA-binding response OmpR family regulator